MLRPPCRKKIRVNSTSSAPVTISVTVAAVDSAPLVSLAWLLRSASMAELPALVIWSLLRCAGPSISHVRVLSMDVRDLFDQSGQAGDELADNERQQAADDRDSAQQDQRHRAAAGRAPAIQKVDRGNHQRGEHQRQGDRHHDEFEPPDHPEQRDAEREDHQQAPCPRRRLVDDWRDRSSCEDPTAAMPVA